MIEGEGSQHSPAAWAEAGATWWIESMWNAVGQAEPVLAALDRLRGRAAELMAGGWNFADLWEAIAERQPDALAQRHAGHSTTWAEFDRRADGVAATLLAAGVAEQDKVAQYLYNAPEYLESMFAAFKAGLATVNTNYRYTADELVYLWDNADVVAVVFHGTFTERIAEHAPPPARASTRGCGSTTGTARAPTGRCRTRTRRRRPPAAPPARGAAPATTSFLLYTGGTTGMPKGVMWRQDDLFGALDAANRKRLPPEQDLDAARERVTKPGPRNLPAAPLMHGTGLFNAISNLMIGGSVITMEGRHFDPVELLDTIETERINSMSIVGDAFAKPILRALDAEPERWDISSLRVIVSSGVMWSAETKAGLLRHNERLIMVDSLGSSEAIGMASSTVTSDDAAATATFQIGPDTRVVTDDGRDVRVGLGRDGPRRHARAHADRLLQGPREVGGDVPRHRRRALLDPRRLRHGRRRRHGAPARPRQPVHQHRRREGLPGGGRGGAQAAPDRRRRGRGRRARRALRRGDHGARRGPRRRRDLRGRR